jgi:hypothetical protein
MAITILEVEKDRLYTVNNKEIYLDSENKWIAKQELTASEMGAFSLYRAANITQL